MTKQTSRVPKRLGWNLFLALHVTSYTLLWVLSFMLLNSQDFFSPSFNPVSVLLLWTPLMFVHIALHYYWSGQANDAKENQQAFREGYRDAMRDLLDSGRLNEREYEIVKTRLELSDDGELIDYEQEKPKRDVLRMRE